MRFEESAEAGSPRRGSPLARARKTIAALPAVMELVPAAAADRAIAQGPERIAVGIELASVSGRPADGASRDLPPLEGR